MFPATFKLDNAIVSNLDVFSRRPAMARISLKRSEAVQSDTSTRSDDIPTRRSRSMTGTCLTTGTRLTCRDSMISTTSKSELFSSTVATS